MNIDINICTDFDKGLVAMSLDHWNLVMTELEKIGTIIYRNRQSQLINMDLPNPKYSSISIKENK